MFRPVRKKQPDSGYFVPTHLLIATYSVKFAGLAVSLAIFHRLY